jgi:predicted RNA-binding protein with PIN domain
MGQPQRIIIDGYNIIYTDESLRRTACKDLERARDQLVFKLKEYLQGRRLRVTLVFDGRGGIAEASTVIPTKLEVIFSAGGQTADELIVSTLERSSNARAFIVVTSDMADIGRTAKKLGCEVIGSKRFLDRISQGAPAKRNPPGEEGGGDYGDTDFWLRKFGEDDAKKLDE